MVSSGNMKFPNSKITAGLLGLFIGGFGPHNYYLGYYKKAAIQFILTALGYILFCMSDQAGLFLAWISSLWGFVEGCLILTGRINKDADGAELE